MIFIPALIGAAIYIAISVAFVRMARARGRVPAVITGMIFALIPTADYVAGTATLLYLCSQERNNRFSAPIVLPAEFFSGNGTANLLKISKETNYIWEIERNARIAWPRVNEYRHRIFRNDSGTVLAETNNFSRESGWAEAFFDQRATICPGDAPSVAQLFVVVESSKKDGSR